MDHALVERLVLRDGLGLEPGDKRITYVGGDYPPSWLPVRSGRRPGRAGRPDRPGHGGRVHRGEPGPAEDAAQEHLVHPEGPRVAWCWPTCAAETSQADAMRVLPGQRPRRVRAQAGPRRRLRAAGHEVVDVRRRRPRPRGRLPAVLPARGGPGGRRPGQPRRGHRRLGQRRADRGQQGAPASGPRWPGTRTPPGWPASTTTPTWSPSGPGCTRVEDACAIVIAVPGDAVLGRRAPRPPHRRDQPRTSRSTPARLADLDHRARACQRRPVMTERVHRATARPQPRSLAVATRPGRPGSAPGATRWRAA